MAEIIRSSKAYKIRIGANGPSRKARTNSMHYVITIPSDIAELVKDKEFIFELTDEGILLRPAEKVSPVSRPLPEWVK